jgi:hypothetical protein
MTSAMRQHGGLRENISGAGLPFPASQHPPFCRQFLLQFLTLDAKLANLDLHPQQEEFSGGGRYTGALKLKDFLALPSGLDAHVLDFLSHAL